MKRTIVAGEIENGATELMQPQQPSDLQVTACEAALRRRPR
ncbi:MULTISPECIES: hypothetical protein [unclassified Bradyrhizobium]